MQKSGRIKEERQRLGLTQAEMAEAAGVSKRSQANYESGDRDPNLAYLEAVARIGVDVGYVLTGTRSVGVRLQPDEADLVSAYRRSSDDMRAASLRVLEASATYHVGAPSAQVAGDAGQVVQGDVRTERQTINVGRPKKRRGA